MKIYGVRIYPQSTTIIEGNTAPIFIHGRVADEYSDFFYVFRPLAPLWRGHFFVNDFGVSYDEQGRKENPIPQLRQQYGSSLFNTDLETQLMLLRGDDFSLWAATLNFCEGFFLPIFREPPKFDLLKNLFWSKDFHLNSNTWPNQMRAVLHMWDDVFWQLFSTERSDIDLLIRTHVNDPKLKMYFVDLDREFPNPTNEGLQPASLAQ